MAVGLATSEVMTDQQLIEKDRREDLGAVVIQAAVPDAIVQFERRFQPLVERLDRLLASSVDRSAFLAVEVVESLDAPLTTLDEPFGLVRRFRLAARVVPPIARAKKASPGGPAVS